MLIQAYNPAWKEDFQQIKAILHNALAGQLICIEHIGSTAIPDLAAKPIIDIDLVYSSPADFEEIKKRLARLGYYHNGDQGIPQREVFKRDLLENKHPVLDKIAHHLYACPFDSPELRRHVSFRNFLTEHQSAREFYQKLKYQIAEEVQQDRKLYAPLKQERTEDFTLSITNKTKPLRLDNPHITVRDWESKDFEHYRYWNTGHHLWMDYNGPYYPNATKEQIELEIKTFQVQIAYIDPQRPYKRLVIADPHTDQLIGTVSWYWQSQETHWKSIGIAIYDENNWGKGLAYEALTLWIDHLFKVSKDIVRLDLRTWSGNIGMMKLGKKLGFKEEARFRNARIVKGQYYDSIGMGILREEWSSREK